MIDAVALPWRFGTIEVPAADRYIREAIDVTGEYSGAEIDLYEALAGPGDVALDVGANVGVFAIALGRAVGPAGRVLAFEPQPPIFALLRRNLAAHDLPQVTACRAMVGAADGEGEFAELRRLPAGALVNFGAVGRHTSVPGPFGGMTPTPIRSVDGLDLKRCDLIKIDVEGAEVEVLAGAAATIARCRPVVCLECDRPGAAEAVADGLLADGYRIWRFRGSNMRVPNPKAADLAGYPSIAIFMLVAVPETRLGLLDGVAMAAMQPIDSGRVLEALSRRIVRDPA